MFSLIVALIASPVSTEIILATEPEPQIATLVMPTDPARAAILFVSDPAGDSADGDAHYGSIGSDRAGLANALAGYSIASIRYAPKDLSGKNLPYMAYASDISTMAEVLTERSQQPCIWLASYMGSTLISHAYAAQNANVCGLVSFSPDTSSPVDFMLETSNYFAEQRSGLVANSDETIAGLGDLIADTQDKSERDALIELRETLKGQQADRKNVSTNPLVDALSAIKNGQVVEIQDAETLAMLPVNLQHYLVALERYDHAATLSGLSVPILAISSDEASAGTVRAIASYKALPTAKIMVFEPFLRTALGPVDPIDMYIPDLPRVPQGDTAKAVAVFILTMR